MESKRIVTGTKTAGALLLGLFLVAWLGMRTSSFHSLGREGSWSLMKAVFLLWCVWIPIAGFSVIRYRRKAGTILLMEFAATLGISCLATASELLR